MGWSVLTPLEEIDLSLKLMQYLPNYHVFKYVEPAHYKGYTVQICFPVGEHNVSQQCEGSSLRGMSVIVPMPL